MSSQSLIRVLLRPPATRASEGLQRLRSQLEGFAVLSRRDPILRRYRYVINWGNSTQFDSRNAVVLNKPEAVALAVDKAASLKKWREDGVTVPDFYDSLVGVDRSGIYLARTVLHGSGGAGIVVVREEDEVPEAPLYTRYIPKREEYRIHVAFGRPIFAQQKRREREAEQDRNQKLIRNYDNGWVFCPVDIPEDLGDVAVAACKSLGLDFGAADIIRGKYDGIGYVLEFNTAPGLSSPTLLESYGKAFRENIQW